MQGELQELVSVLIGTYNAEHLITQTLQSLLAQTYRAIEIIVVDDGSSDGTWRVLESFGSAIRAFRQKNGGVAEARNTGLREARGSLIALMDHDDLCEPERIASEVAFLRQHPEVVLCSSEFSAFDSRGMLATAYSGEYYSQCHESRGGVRARYPSSGHLDIASALAEPSAEPVLVPTCFGPVYEQLAQGNFVHPPTVLFRSSVLVQAGHFDKNAGMMCDWDWLVRVSRHGDFGYLDRSLLRYRRSDTQISSPRHHARASIDTVRVAMDICLRDPELYRRRAPEFNQQLGVMHLDAAYANAETRRWTSLRLLATSVARYGTLNGESWRTLFKILMPDAWLARIRRHRMPAAGTA